MSNKNVSYEKLESVLRDCKKGFVRCKETISKLQDDNHIIAVKLDAYESVLNAVNGHREEIRSTSPSSDIMWEIQRQQQDIGNVLSDD